MMSAVILIKKATGIKSLPTTFYKQKQKSQFNYIITQII